MASEGCQTKYCDIYMLVCGSTALCYMLYLTSELDLWQLFTKSHCIWWLGRVESCVRSPQDRPASLLCAFGLSDTVDECYHITIRERSTKRAYDTCKFTSQRNFKRKFFSETLNRPESYVHQLTESLASMAISSRVMTVQDAFGQCSVVFESLGTFEFSR